MFHYEQTMEPTQREQLPGTVPNSAGGYSFEANIWTRLDRFLVLGTESDTYYASARALSRENAAATLQCISEDGPRVVARIVEISDEGRAPKNDPALFALALCAKTGDPKTRAAALLALPKVARIATHLFHFAEYVKAMGGWGSGPKRAFANWYRHMADERLVLQAIKYQQRDGWSHRDLLRKAHPVPVSERQKTVFHWMTQGWESVGEAPHNDPVLAQIWAFERGKRLLSADDKSGRTDKEAVREMVRLITDYNLPHECVLNEMKGSPEIWEAMLPSMGLGAMVRNLAKMTAIGLTGPLSKATALVCERLSDVEAIRKARLHPMSLLVALKIYEQGHGEKGSLVWSPTGTIVDALDGAFYQSFKTVEPTNKRFMLALDVSASMNGPDIAGMPGISPRVASAAMSLVTANVEPQHAFTAFTSGIVPITISPRSRLDDVVRYLNKMPFGGTDCAAPMVYALEHRIPVDTFVIYTDNETVHGDIHPCRALQQYRQKMGIAAKLVTVGMIANKQTIADPNDSGMLDVVGFDTATPAVIADFAR
jgi:60 kDa SS-A/Ro ribonucleoprotein